MQRLLISDDIEASEQPSSLRLLPVVDQGSGVLSIDMTPDGVANQTHTQTDDYRYQMAAALVRETNAVVTSMTSGLITHPREAFQQMELFEDHLEVLDAFVEDIRTLTAQVFESYDQFSVQPDFARAQHLERVFDAAVAEAGAFLRLKMATEPMEKEVRSYARQLHDFRAKVHKALNSYDLEERVELREEALVPFLQEAADERGVDFADLPIDIQRRIQRAFAHYYERVVEPHLAMIKKHRHNPYFGVPRYQQPDRVQEGFEMGIKRFLCIFRDQFKAVAAMRALETPLTPAQYVLIMPVMLTEQIDAWTNAMTLIEGLEYLCFSEKCQFLGPKFESMVRRLGQNIDGKVFA